jgi:hypothetical protein
VNEDPRQKNHRRADDKERGWHLCFDPLEFRSNLEPEDYTARLYSMLSSEVGASAQVDASLN